MAVLPSNTFRTGVVKWILSAATTLVVSESIRGRAAWRNNWLNKMSAMSSRIRAALTHTLQVSNTQISADALDLQEDTVPCVRKLSANIALVSV